MIRIHYFASLREQLQTESEQIEWNENLTTVESLKTYLSQRGDKWEKLLHNHTTLTAVNQHMANNDTPLKVGDEIAFFPPVTGG